jgi:hypothetical protein
MLHHTIVTQFQTYVRTTAPLRSDLKIEYKSSQRLVLNVTLPPFPLYVKQFHPYLILICFDSVRVAGTFITEEPY